MLNNTGWICPRCASVNSPVVRQCSCTSIKDRHTTPFRMPDDIFTPVNPSYPPYTVTSKEIENNMFKVHPENVSY